MPALSASVVLCTRRRLALLAPTLDALALAVAQAPGTEVVVVEQAGADAASLTAARGFRHLVDPGMGVSRARNAGRRASAGEIVLHTDDDCLVPPSWVADHLAVLADPAVAGSFGEVRGLPRHEGDGSDGARRPLSHRHPAPPWDVGHASNLAVRRTALEAVGGFDERIGPGAPGVQAGEDADLIARLLRHGFVLASGTGTPVQHADWRSDDEDLATLLAYERGAGVWMGAALRAGDVTVRHHLRARSRMLRARVSEPERAPGDGRRLAGALAVGVLRGLALSPWPGGR